MSGEEDRGWGGAERAIEAARLGEQRRAVGAAYEWPGLTTGAEVAFDPEGLRAVASDLRRMGEDLRGSAAGNTSDLVERADQSRKFGFGAATIDLCPVTIKAIHAYHQRVLASVKREYGNVLLAIDAVAHGLEVTAQNLDDGEQNNVASIARVDAVADGAAPPPSGQVPIGSVGPDGSFG